METTIEKMIMEACDLPAVPAVANKVMKLLADPNTSSQKICRAIADDQALTSRILKIANSAFYGCLRTINNLQAAVVVVGYNAIRSLVLAVSTKEVYAKFGLTERMLWEHAVGTGIACHVLAKETGVTKADDVFVCGLMHDVGKVIMNNSESEKYRLVMEKTYNDGMPSLLAEEEIFGFNHAEVGALVVKKWNLTEELEKAVRYHHDCGAVADEDQYIVVLTSMVHLADLICQRLGIGAREANESIDLTESEAIATIGLSKDRVEELSEKIERTYLEEKHIFE
ncbi:MAG: HDOD domain-containing protein [bacterium]|nr:HDOD domain-containing protein [bacterium]